MREQDGEYPMSSTTRSTTDRRPTMGIENTTKRDNLDHLLGVMSGGQSAYIEGMEAAGQRQLVNSDRLPTEVLHGDRSEFEALGFVFGDPDPDDPMFTPATLPEGWTRKGSSHAMWSYIVDERGIERVAIFYKAAFYDRSAHMSLSNPGYSLATKFIYWAPEDSEGDGEPPWDVLTDEERAAFIESLEDYVQSAERHPDIYGDRLPRVTGKLAEVRG